MHIDGITWHASVMDKDGFVAMRDLVTGTLGLTPMMELPGVAVFGMRNGSMLELYEEGTPPPYGYNDGGIAFGFRVDDIDAASAELKAAGAELLGEITRADGRQALRLPALPRPRRPRLRPQPVGVAAAVRQDTGSPVVRRGSRAVGETAAVWL